MAVVYLHKRNDTNEVFYVGIGKTEKRAFSKKDRNKYWKHIVEKYGYIVDILVSETPWEDACKIEKLLIEKYGRKDLGLGNLVNMTDGGEGNNNPSIETRQKLSKGQKGKLSPKKGIAMSKETRQKMSEARKGITLSEETKQKMSEAKKSRNLSEETRQKMSEARKGKKLSDETKQKMSESMKGKTNTEEVRKKISEALKGKKQSPEHIANKVASHKANKLN